MKGLPRDSAHRLAVAARRVAAPGFDGGQRGRVEAGRGGATRQHGRVIDVFVSEHRDIASARTFVATSVLAHRIPTEVITDRGAALANVTPDLIPAAFHDKVFAYEPALTGHSGLDAAYAALACWLAHRDGWEAPGWARDPDRVARPWWFVSDSAYGRAWALAQSPGEFRIRGVFITDTALARV